jgi:hypothetical protein
VGEEKPAGRYKESSSTLSILLEEVSSTFLRYLVIQSTKIVSQSFFLPSLWKEYAIHGRVLL